MGVLDEIKAISAPSWDWAWAWAELGNLAHITTVLYLWIIGARVRSRTKYVNKYLLAVCNCILPWENIQLIIVIIITTELFSTIAP